MPTKHITANSPLTDFIDPNTIFVIEDPLNLRPIQGQDPLTITLGAYSVLTFTDDGAISNGTIEGNLSSIDFVGQENRLSNVTLTGTWVGSVCDLVFAYDTTPSVKPLFNDILKSLLRFQKIDLSRSEYFLQWEAVNPNATDEPRKLSHDIEFDGHGATIYLASNKGSTTNGDQGPQYDASPFFLLDTGNLNCFVLKNLTIADNAATSPYTGYGEANVNSQHIVYSIFEGLASCRTEFRNVRYDGGGEFLKCHNDSRSVNLLLFKDCDLHTNGHAVKIACEVQTGAQGSGSLTEAVFDHCNLLNHFSRFAGVLSFTGAGLTGRLKLHGTRVGGYRGNLELSGVGQLFINKCVLVNHGTCSEVRTSGGETYPTVCHCTASQFLLSDSPGWNGSYTIMGRVVHLMNNRLVCHEELVFSHIERLFCHNNRIEVPTLTAHVIDTDSTVGIGYYGNNTLYNPWINDGPYSFRLNTASVLAQYEPFRSMFRNALGDEIDCTSFNWTSGFQDMFEINDILEELEETPLTLTQVPFGYAIGYTDPVILESSSPHDTVTVSLTGRSSGNPPGNTINDLVSCPTGEVTPLAIKCSANAVFSVYIGQTCIHTLPRREEDVQLDVTVTQINDRFEIFVFVNGELVARYRNDDCDQYIPSVLTFTPNACTAILAIRFVPGGFILDEPEALMTELFDNEPIRIPEMEE